MIGEFVTARRQRLPIGKPMADIVERQEEGPAKAMPFQRRHRQIELTVEPVVVAQADRPSMAGGPDIFRHCGSHGHRQEQH
jgi:hypothetical protein